MSSVLDASAIIAVLRGEPGAEIVLAADEGVISAVNFAEVITALINAGMPSDHAQRAAARSTGLKIVPADQSQAIIAGRLREQTRSAGLSLGDRFCIALASQLGAKALTADRQWCDLDVGVEVVLIR